MKKLLFGLMLLGVVGAIFAVPTTTGKVSLYLVNEWLSNRYGIFPEDSTWHPNIGAASRPFNAVYADDFIGSFSGTADSALYAVRALDADTAAYAVRALDADTAAYAVATSNYATLDSISVGAGGSIMVKFVKGTSDTLLFIFSTGGASLDTIKVAGS